MRSSLVQKPISEAQSFLAKKNPTANQSTSRRAGKPITVRVNLNPSTARLIHQFASRAGMSVNDVANQALAFSYRANVGQAAGK